MNVADELFISILRHKSEIILSQVHREWLDTSELSKHNFVVNYYREHGELPGPKSYCSRFKVDGESIDSRPALYLKQLKNRYIFTRIAEDVTPLLRKAKDKPEETLTQLRDFCAGLVLTDSGMKETLYSDDAMMRLIEYEKRILTKGVSYLSMGHPLLDSIFYGYREKDLVTIGGRAGSKKTFLLCYLAMLLEKVLPPDMGDILFFSMEMSSDEIKERQDCLRFKLPYGDFLKGELSKTKSKLKIIDDINYLEELESKVLIHKPAAVFLDGSYLLEPNEAEGWEKVTRITRALKRIVKQTNCPIINTTQLKRASGKGGKGTSFEAQDEFAYSNSYVQDSDLAIRMFQDKEMVFRSEIGMQVAKGRRVAPDAALTFMCNLNLMQVDFTDEVTEIPAETIY